MSTTAVYVARFHVFAYGSQANSPNRYSGNSPFLYSKESRLRPPLPNKKGNLTNSQDVGRPSNSIVEATAECTSTIESTDPRSKSASREKPNFSAPPSRAIDWDGELIRSKSQKELIPSFAEEDVDDTTFFSLANDKDLCYENGLSPLASSPASSDLIYTIPLSDDEGEVPLGVTGANDYKLRNKSRRSRNKRVRRIGNLMNFLKDTARVNSSPGDETSNAEKRKFTDSALKWKTLNRDGKVERRDASPNGGHASGSGVRSNASVSFPTQRESSDFKIDQIERLEKSLKGKSYPDRDYKGVSELLDTQLLGLLGPSSAPVSKTGMDFGSLESKEYASSIPGGSPEVTKVSDELNFSQHAESLSSSSSGTVPPATSSSPNTISDITEGCSLGLSPENILMVQRFDSEIPMHHDMESTKEQSKSSDNKGKSNKSLTKKNRESKVNSSRKPYTVLSESLARVRQAMSKTKNGLLDARRLLQELNLTHGDHPRVLEHWAQLEIKCGNHYVARKRFMESVRVYEETNKFDSSYFHTLNSWASMESSLGNLTQARSLYQRAVSNAEKADRGNGRTAENPTVVSLHSWAMSEMSEGNWANARELFHRAEDIQPLNAVVLQSRALMEAKVHNYSIARSYFRRACEADPKDSACLQAWAIFEAERGRTTKMRSLFSQALQVSPKNTYVLQAWAHQEGLLKTKESLERAKSLYKKCTEISPNSVHAWQAWGLLEFEMKNFTEAKQLFESCIHIAPKNVPSLQAYARLEMERGNLREAKELISVAIKIQPRNPAALMVAAQIDEKAGLKSLAYDLYVRASMEDKVKARKQRRMFVQRKRLLQFETSSQEKRNQTTSELNNTENQDSESGIPPSSSHPPSLSSRSHLQTNGEDLSSSAQVKDDKKVTLPLEVPSTENCVS